MTEYDYTRQATWQDVLHVMALLQEHQVDCMLVGGYALRAYGYGRQTQDIDIAVSSTPQNAKKWILALAQLPDGAAKDLIGEDDPFNGDYQHAIRINDEITIDIMPSVAGIAYEQLKTYCQTIKTEEREIPVLSLKGLLKTKELSLREQDKHDARLLSKALKELNEHGPIDDPDDVPRM